MNDAQTILNNNWALAFWADVFRHFLERGFNVDDAAGCATRALAAQKKAVAELGLG